MTNNAAVLLCNPREKARRVNKCDQWNVETIAHAHEAGHLIRRIDIDHTCHDGRFLSDDADTMSANACQPYNRIPCPTGLELKERSSIHDLFNDLMHDVWLGRINRHDAIKRLIHISRTVTWFCKRRILNIV